MELNKDCVHVQLKLLILYVAVCMKNITITRFHIM